MFKVNISNASQNLSWSAQFPTEQEAENWLNSQIGKPHRLPEREVPIYDGNGNPILDENGDPVIGTLPAEFTSEIVDITASHNLAQEKIKADKYLKETDWYVTRLVERSVPIPSEVIALRLAAVQKLNE